MQSEKNARHTFHANGGKIRAGENVMQNKKGSISAALLCSSAILAKFLIVMPEYMVKYNANSAWIEIVAKCILASICFYIIVWLYKPFQYKSFDMVSEIAFGKIGRTVISIFYITGLIVFNAGLLRMLTEALRTIGLNSAKPEYFALFILTAVFIGMYMGISPTTNISTIIFPFVILSLLLVGVIMQPHYRIENILPVLGKGANVLVDSIFLKHFGFFEIMLLFFFAPQIGSLSDIRKAGSYTFFIVALFSVFFTLTYCLAVPYPASQNFFLPLYQLSRMIKAGSFLQRMEPLIVFVWTGVILCSMSATLSLVTKLMNNGKETAERKAYVPLTVFTVFFLSVLPETEIQAFLAYEYTLRYGYILFPLLPAIVLITAKIRKAGRNG